MDTGVNFKGTRWATIISALFLKRDGNNVFLLFLFKIKYYYDRFLENKLFVSNTMALIEGWSE